MGKIYQRKECTQECFAYEMRFTTLPPDKKWRVNHVALIFAKSIQHAIELVNEYHPHDPIIDQVVLRNRSMDVILGIPDA